MFSYIDNILFPDKCILLTHPRLGYIYPIYKNASSTIGKLETIIVDHSDFDNVKDVLVFVRDPVERYISGLATYIYNNNYQKDIKVVMDILTTFLFNDRHFCPQLFWLINLRRFIDCNITIKNISYLNKITKLKLAPDKIDLDPVTEFVMSNNKLLYYLQMDKVVTECLINKTVRFEDIIETLKTEFPDLYKDVFLKSINICSVLD